MAKMVSKGEISRGILNSDDVTWINESDPNKIMSEIAKICNAHKFKVQILAPGRNGFVGTHQVNGLVHNLIFPSVEQSDFQYQRGEKVVCVKNLYTRTGGEIDIDNSVFNGEVGYVVDQGKKNYKVCFEPNNKKAEVDKENLDLAYCLTVHKSQGSEYDTVCLVLNKYHDIMLNNELFYTAITRSKTKLYIIGCDYCILKSVKTPCPRRFSNIASMVNCKT
jgi:exodeoxyribonuclease V alpha subunit